MILSTNHGRFGIGAQTSRLQVCHWQATVAHICQPTCIITQPRVVIMLRDCSEVQSDNKQQPCVVFSVKQSCCVVAGTALKMGSSKRSFTAVFCVLLSTSNSWGFGAGSSCSVRAETFPAAHLHKPSDLLQCPHSAQAHECQNC